MGVKNKVISQLKAFKNDNYDYKILNTDGNKIRKHLNMMKKINNSCSNVYYFRNIGLFFFLYIKTLKKLKKEKKILILEIPTPLKNFIKEKKVNSSRKIFCLKNMFFKINYPSIFKYFDIIIEYAPESEKYTKGNEEKFIYINNGVDVNSIKIKEEKKDNKNLNILSVANNSKWHGYDRIIKGLPEYYKTNPEKEVYYHCVGEGSELTNLKKLTKELNLEKYVVFHGTKTGEDLDKVVDECDIALGSLGNHRKGLYADSALKNREYCARGIPFVIASDDQDFPETFPFVYRIPKDDTPVDVSQVIKWYENLIKEHPNYSMEMRRYAEENLTWDAKMKPVVERINEILKERNFDK